MKVLVAEDNRLLGKSVKKGLEESGFKVDLCINGQEALYHLEEAQFDLALLDWMLPVVSGIEVLKSLRLRNDFVPVIMITSKRMLVALTTKEFDLLLLLAINNNKLSKRQFIFDSIYHMNESPESNSLDVILARVRKKLHGSGVEIVTLRGKGFMLRAQ